MVDGQQAIIRGGCDARPFVSGGDYMGTVEKRPGKRGMAYRTRVELPRDPLAKQRRWKSITAPTKKALEDEVVKVKHRIATGTYIEESTATVAEYLTYWLQAVTTEMRGSAWARHERDVRCHLIPLFGATKLQDLTPMQIEIALRSRLATHAPTSVKRMYAVLHRALARAVYPWRLLNANPSDGVTLSRAAHHEMTVWSEVEVKRFLTLTSSDHHAALWRLAVLVGLRKGELLGLQWSDLDIARRTLTVRRTLTIDKENRPILGAPKTKAGKRTITLPPSCVSALQPHRRAQQAVRSGLGNLWQEHDLIFPTADGNLLGREFPYYHLKQLIKRHNLTPIRFHDLRHTAATLMLQQGVSPRVVQERLGHSSIAMTLGLYSHVTLTMQEEAATKMDAMFGMNGAPLEVEDLDTRRAADD
jgi:integrase